MKNLTFSNILITLLFVLCFSVSIFGQVNKEINKIKTYSRTLDALINKNKNRHPVFADVSDYRKDTDPIWRKYNSTSIFKKASKKMESYQIVDVWQKRDQIAVANFSYFTPSGDWAHFVNHYYREDGTLAKVQAQLNVFGLEGLISVFRDFYFDRNGKLLRKTTKYYDHEAKKSKKAGEVHFMDREIEIFKTTGELPFASLLTKHKGN